MEKNRECTKGGNGSVMPRPLAQGAAESIFPKA